MDAPGTDDPLARFNAAPMVGALEAVHGCLAAPAFAMVLVAGRPYPSVEALVARAEQLARALPWRDVERALEAHPRIGDRVPGASASAREQAGMDDADAELRTAMAEGNRAYEERFGHVFLIRAAGRSGPEMLAELQRRLANDPAAERTEVTAQLAEITALRVRGLVT